MLKLLAFRGVVCNVACNIWQRFKADRPVQFHQPNSAIEIEEKLLTYNHVVFSHEERADKFPAVRARNAKVLGATIVLLLTGDLRVDGHNLLSKRIVIVALVQLRRVLQVHLENETCFSSTFS